MRISLLVFAGLLILMPLSGQESKIKFGKVSREDLDMKTYDPDPEADAVVLSDIGLIKFDANAVNTTLVRFHHVVIKILNARGKDAYGNLTIPYYAYNRVSFITNLKAIVHLPDGTDIKLKSEQFLDEEINMYFRQKKIAFPSLVEGAIIEYEYQLSSTNFFYPVDWFLQGKSPIRYAELTVLIPNWFEYVVLTQGQTRLKQEKTQQADVSGDIVFNKWIYVSKDVPALKEEKYITTMDDYYSRVRFRLNAYQLPNHHKENVLNSWEKVAESLWNSPSFGYQLNNKRPGELVLEAAGITANDTRNLVQKITQVYQYINGQIEPNGLISIGADAEVQEILKKRTGSSGQMNKLMLAALLQLGVEAYPVMISTRENGKVFEQYPFIEQFNHMLVLAKIDGVDTWIDTGNPKRPIGLVAARSMNSRGWVAARKNPFWTDIPSQESKTVIIVKGSLTAEGVFTGEVEGRFSGFHALDQRVNYNLQPSAYFNDVLTCGNIHAAVSELEVINAVETEQPFQIKGTIASLPAGEKGNDKIYLSLVQLQSLLDNPFKQAQREYPVEFNYPEDYTLIFDVFLPENFTVETLPKSAKYTTDQNGVQVSLQSSSMHGKLNLITRYSVKNLFFPPQEYQTLKNIFGLRKDLFSDQIVLSRQE